MIELFMVGADLDSVCGRKRKMVSRRMTREKTTKVSLFLYGCGDGSSLRAMYCLSDGRSLNLRVHGEIAALKLVISFSFITAFDYIVPGMQIRVIINLITVPYSKRNYYKGL